MAQREQQHGERLRWSCLDEIWQPTYPQFVWTEMAQLQSQGERDGLRWTARILDANKGLNINTKAVRPQQLEFRDASSLRMPTAAAVARRTQSTARLVRARTSASSWPAACQPFVQQF
jgi:hypothetical protein